MEIAVMYRMYKGTVQRVLLSLDALNSSAGYLVVVKRDKRAFCWIGSKCETDDKEAIKEIGWKVIARDFKTNELLYDDGTPKAIKVITEGEEERSTSDSKLEFVMLLDLLWTNTTFYFSRLQVNNRLKALHNSPISVGYIGLSSSRSNIMGSGSSILRSIGANDPYRFVETTFAHPDATGSVHRITFVPIEADTIAYVNVGDIWEVWIADLVSPDEEDKAIKFISDKVASLLQLPFNATRTEILKQYIQVIHPGDESYMFKHYFKKFTSFNARIAPRPISNSALNRKEREAEEEEEDDDDDADEEKQEGADDHDDDEEEGADDAEQDFFRSVPSSSRTAVIESERQVVNLISLPKPMAPNMVPVLSVFKFLREQKVDSSKVTEDMFAIKEGGQVSMTDRRRIIMETAMDPSSLIGYQVDDASY
jgi:hypothetical protein